MLSGKVTSKARLGGLVYPCYFVVHGPERDYRTRFRGEHAGAFRSGMVQNAEEAYAMIISARYLGHYHEMNLIAISYSHEDGELKETPI